jgi:hypothetical protein
LQSPQCCVLLLTFTHEPPQFLVPPPQLSVHAPSKHTSCALQAFGHEPQCRASLSRSTHALPQRV